MSRVLATLITVVIAALAACTPSSSSPPTQLDCMGVIDCARACGADAGAGCTQGCVDRATPATHDQLVALVQCDQTQACGGDQACLEANCAAEVASCEAVSPTRDAGTTSGDLPSKYVGTVTQDLGSVGLPQTSTGQVVFVRDDTSVPSLASSGFAVYRLQSITYVAKESGSFSGCTRTASETVTVNDPNALENHFAIQPQTTSGMHAYDVAVSHHEKRVGALTQVCSIGGTTQEDFNADINVSRGTDPLLTADVWNVSATVVFGQTWSWELKGE